MNKTMKWIYIALFCILLGGALIVSVGSLNGWSLSNFSSTVHLTQKEFTVKEDFRAIDLRGSLGSDVSLLPAEDGLCRVVMGVSDEEGIETIVEVRGGVLYVTRRDTRPWYQRFSIVSMPGEDDVTVYLPETRLEALDLQSASGQVMVSGGLVFGRVSVTCSSGDIRFLANAKESLSLQTNSGDIALLYAVCGDVALKSSSGKIQVKELQCGDFRSQSSSGDQLLEDLAAAGDLKAVSSSGEKTLRRVTAGGDAVLESSSGDVELEKFDAASVAIRTSSGEVKGTVARRMDFSASSSSGDIRLPESDPKGGAFRVTTSSGDVKIRLA